MTRIQFPSLSAVLISLSVLQPLYAEPISDDLKDINVPMTELGHLLETTLPLVYDDDAFSDPANEGLIQDRLKQLRLRFNTAEPHLKQKSVTYKISGEVLMDQLASAQSAFERGEIWLTQHIIKGVPRVCMSCHLQDHEENKLFQHVKLDDFSSDFSKAEVSFVSRDYPRALQYYESFLALPDQDSTQQLKALERMLVIYSDIYKQPKEIYTRLQKYQNSKNLDRSVKQTLSQWLEGLDEYIQQSGLTGDGVDYQQLDHYMQKHYTRIENQWVPVLNQQKDKIFYIMLRASLYDYLNESPSTEEIPALLYWLAVCDRTLEYGFYFSLADWYLRECVTHYSSHPYAQKCYQAYEDYLTYSYTGSRGTEIPPEVQEELVQLKSKLPKKADQEKS